MNILAGNWKMNLSRKEAVALISEINTIEASLDNTEVWVAPPFLHIPTVVENSHEKIRVAYDGPSTS